jgi:hypothetical protein
VNGGWTSGRTRASSLSETASSYKTSDDGVDDHDVSEGLELELRWGSPHGPRFTSPIVAPHMQGSIPMSRTCV